VDARVATLPSPAPLVTFGFQRGWFCQFRHHAVHMEQRRLRVLYFAGGGSHSAVSLFAGSTCAPHSVLCGIRRRASHAPSVESDRIALSYRRSPSRIHWAGICAPPESGIHLSLGAIRYQPTSASAAIWPRSTRRLLVRSSCSDARCRIVAHVNRRAGFSQSAGNAKSCTGTLVDGDTMIRGYNDTGARALR
jgi:hypothetical protein